MSRFNNLEFGEESDGHLEAEARRQPDRSQGLIKGEADYLAEAQSHFEAGYFDRALRAYSKVLEFNALNPAAWTGQVRMLIELNDFQKAKLWADKGLEKFPNEPELLAAKAVALARLGDLKGALAYSDASIEERGDTPYIWLVRGDVQLARRERKADFSFERALLLAPRNWFVRWLAARIHYYYKKAALALRLVQEALSYDAGQVVLWLQLGLCQHALGLIPAAKASFQHAHELSAYHPEVDAALREVYRAGFWSRVSGRWRHLFGG